MMNGRVFLVFLVFPVFLVFRRCAILIPCRSVSRSVCFPPL
jgi:hypothetical protein